MYDSIIKDRQQWLTDTLPGAARWKGQPVAPLPEGLLEWLVDLRLLRHVPFHYLVPDPQLLPSESARFFYVDPTFTDRLVDGALAAGNIGTMDQGFSAHVMQAVRKQVDDALAARVDLGPDQWSKVIVTGLLLRSSAVRRWPGLEIRAWKDLNATTRIKTLRQERLSEGVSIALFAGIPTRVDIQEPNEGTHFGLKLEPGSPPSFSLAPRNDQDQSLPAFAVHFRGESAFHLIDFAAMTADIDQALGAGAQTIDSSRLALSLQRTPYVQVFRDSSPQDGQFLDALTTKLELEVQGG